MKFNDRLVNKKDKTVTINKLDNSAIKNKICQPELIDDRNSITKVLVTDTETTGVNKDKDKVIEFTGSLIAIDNNGNYLGLINEYSSLNDPGFPIPEDATKVNGITDDMVQGKKIDTERLDQIFYDSDLIVAHNARFDRAFIDKILPLSKEKPWGCSMLDVDWKSKGCDSMALGVLGILHGFYFEAHRASADVYATIYLLTAFRQKNGKNYITELLANASKQYYLMSASFKYNEKIKNHFKSLGFKWNDYEKSWYKISDLKMIEKNRKEVENLIGMTGYVLTIKEVPIQDRYRS